MATKQGQLSTMTAYIAGPMTGIQDYNAHTFNKAEKAIQGIVEEVINPHNPDDIDEEGKANYSREYYIRRAAKQVSEAEMIVMLPLWEISSGARMELRIACEIDMPVYKFKFQKQETPGIEPVSFPKEKLIKAEAHALDMK
jgi:hypothetical protein